MEQSVTRCLLCIRAPALAVPYDTNAHWPLGPAQSFSGAKACAPKGADYQWGKDPLEQLMVRFDSWRAVRLGNWLGWNLATKSTVGGRATWRAVTRVKLEQASKAVMWMPTRRFSGEGRADPEGTRRGSAPNAITIGTDRATGVGSTARPEGSLLPSGHTTAGGREERTWATIRRRRVCSGSDGRHRLCFQPAVAEAAYFCAYAWT